MAGVTDVIEELLAGEMIDTNDVAAVLGSTQRSVSRWATTKTRPRRQTEDRLLELKAVVDLLRTALREEPARRWLRSPNPGLDWRKPLEVIADGDYRRVVAVILAIAEGVTS